MRDVPLRIEVTMERATHEWLSQYSSANTRAAYTSDLRTFLSWLGDQSSPLGVSPEEIDGGVSTRRTPTKQPDPERSCPCH